MDISSYTRSEQPRVAGKHLTRLAKNDMAAVTYSNPASWASKLLVGSETAVAGYFYVSLNSWRYYFSFKTLPVSFKCSLFPKMNLNACIKKEPTTIADVEFEVNYYEIKSSDY